MHTINRIIFAVVFAVLAGCANLDTARSEIANRGAAAMDQALEDAEFVQCRGISIGAWIRKYGSNPVLAAAWRVLCGYSLEMQTPSAAAPAAPTVTVPVIVQPMTLVPAPAK